VFRALGVDIERLQRWPVGQQQQLVGIDVPVVRQQDAHRHVGAIPGADTADGLVPVLILYPIARMSATIKQKLPRVVLEGAIFWRREWDS
jgi:hypothetical protein